MSAGNKAYRQSIRYFPYQQAIEIAAVKKGNKRQALVGSSLKRIKKKGYIVDGGVFASHSPEDGKGKDAWLLRRDKKMIEFQIKGCDKGAKEHLKTYPQIPVTIIRGCESKEEVDCLLIDQYHLESSPKASTKGTNGIPKWQPVAGKPTVQPTVFFFGSNGSSNGSCKKHAQSVPCC